MQIDKNELVQLMLKEAIRFVQDWQPHELQYYIRKGHTGPPPTRFKPSLADKMIFRKLMENTVKGISSEYRIAHNAPMFARIVLFNDYYPNYDCFNRCNKDKFQIY